MKRLLLLLLLLPSLLPAQTDEFGRLARYFASLSDFDYRYPREAVYLHLDNNAYFEGETLWLKAYVVRASSLVPAPLSRVLYVELLDADGELVERKLLRVDSLGQADGEFKLDLPVRGGRFYEVRAYTREMLNWGAEACFSRVVPVFRKADAARDELQIERPEAEADLGHNHPRPYDFGRKGRRLDFYPEGGSRVAGVAGRVAFSLTDRRGNPLDETLRILRADGTELLTAAPRHEGRGAFTLPADCDEAFAEVAGERFALPRPDTAARYTLAARMDGDLDIVVQRRADVRPSLLGLAVMCRDEAVYFDTLTVGSAPVEIQVARRLLGDGVNRVELFDATGRSLARRLVWGPPTARRVTMRVRQNAETYGPLEPVALEMYLTDVRRRPVQTTFSLAVREAASDAAASPEADLATEMLLASELRGYVHNPAYYFEQSEAGRAEALDDLLMVQGWTANSFAVAAGADSFALRHPVEDRLVLSGRVLKDNDREQARAGATLALRMFNRDGYSLTGDVVTDSLGGFTFGSSEDYTGDWVAQFSTRVDGKLRWSRVTLDRWFLPEPRHFSPLELTLQPPRTRPGTADTEADIFVWNDTLPPATMPFLLGEAVVTHQGYRGLRGNKFSYQGGERAGMRHATQYFNIEQLVERQKDNGGQPGLIWDVLRERDPSFDYFPSLDTSDRQYMQLLQCLGDTGTASADVYMFRYAGRPAMVFVDNELFMQLKKGDQPQIFADEVKSVVVMRDPSQWRNFLSSSILVTGDLLGLAPTAVFLYTRPDFSFFRTKKGVEKRTVHGYAPPAAFYSPDYRTVEPPTDDDHRRTLYWNPSVTSDAQGKATAVFFSNSHEGQTLSISARGVTATGGLLHYER
ncbi:MAG: hypothetical protein J6M53_08105 [Bacteroidaceae bacterium]|nr:hypothetical protein [Bacteroidaceae bacterium]